MKTGEHYYNSLPLDVREKFKANFVEQKSLLDFVEYGNEEFDDIGSFICKAFTWDRSNEGWEYWDEIYYIKIAPPDLTIPINILQKELDTWKGIEKPRSGDLEVIEAIERGLEKLRA